MVAVLALFVVLVTTEVARADDGSHVHHHTQQTQTADDAVPAIGDTAARPAGHVDGGCHCLFTNCVPVLPVCELSLGVTVVPFRHPGLPVLSAWTGLGSPPPSEPPRT